MASTFSSSSADYCSVLDGHPSDHQNCNSAEEEEFRVYVYRSVGGIWMMAPRQPTFRGPRPVEFPAALDVFLWGGLSTALHEGLLPLYRRMMLCLLVCYFVVLMVSTVVLSDALTVPNQPVMNVARLIGLVVLSLMVAGLHTNLVYMGTIHARIDDAVRRVSQPFRRAGYALSVETVWSCSWCGCFGRDCYVKIVPLSGGSLPMGLDDDNDDNNFDNDYGVSPYSTTHPHREFPVAVFYAKGWAGILCGSRAVTSFSEARDVGMARLVDSYAWGAIATQLHPLVCQYVNAQTWILVVGGWLGQVLVYLPVWMPQWFGGWDDSWWFTLLILGWFAMVLCSDNWLARFVLETVLRRNVLGQMKSVIDDLSPQVETRSGYALQFELIQEGCCGATGAYVRFVPTSHATAAAVLEEGATTAVAMVDWHKRGPSSIL